MRWERGGDFAAPSTPHEPNVGLVIFYCVFDDLSRGCERWSATTMRGAGESLCGMPTFSTNIHGTAALCRPDMPHTLRSPAGGIEAATAPPFMATQGLSSATGTRALSPRGPDFPSFPEKRRKTRKANDLRGMNNIDFVAHSYHGKISLQTGGRRLIPPRTGVCKFTAPPLRAARSARMSFS